VFRDLYHAGLAGNQATGRYYYRDDQYRDLLAADWSTTYVAQRNGEPVAASVFLKGGRALGHYHLAGQNETGRAENASYLLIDQAAESLGAQGTQWLHLGGGRTASPEDALFLFKSRFSELRVPFHVGGLIFDRDAFERLGGFAEGRFRAYRFAPPAPQT
jgi:lipid II:glycine glycyltransferase (peptidoglycan interpeptide bridge formation enzyme)